MPDTNESDRERLLRLIDGGPEVLKQVQEERQPEPEEKKSAATVPATPISPEPERKKETIFDQAKAFLSRARWKNLIPLIKITLVFFFVVVAIRSAFDFIQSFKKSEKVSSPSPAGTNLTPADDSGIGLRLVGVDWSEAPVALLENLKSGKTYFARKNDKINGAQVKQIFKDKVLVTFHGKTMELR